MKTRKFIIRITKGDIRDGIRGSCHDCPVALALMRAFRSFLRPRLLPYKSDKVMAYCNIMRLGLLGGWVNRAIPVKARKFISEFDRRKPVKPFQFTLSIPVHKLTRPRIAK